MANFKTVDELVEDVSRHSSDIGTTIMTSYPETLLRILRLDSNKPSIHDLKLIDCCIKKYSISSPYIDILYMYKTRKV